MLTTEELEAEATPENTVRTTEGGGEYVSAFSSNPTREDATRIAHTVRYGEDWFANVNDVQEPLTPDEEVNAEFDALTLTGDIEEAQSLKVTNKQEAEQLSMQAQQAYIQDRKEFVTKRVAEAPISVEEKAKILSQDWLHIGAAPVEQAVKSYSKDYSSHQDRILEPILTGIKQDKLLHESTQRMWEEKGKVDILVEFGSLLFGSAYGAKLGSLVAEVTGDSTFSKAAKGTVLHGEILEDFSKRFKKIPHDKQLEYIEKATDFLENNSGFVGDSNFFLASQMLDVMLSGYSGVDRAIDNTFSIVETVPFVAGALRAVAPVATVARALRLFKRFAKPAAAAEGVMVGKKKESVLTAIASMRGEHAKVAKMKVDSAAPEDVPTLLNIRLIDGAIVDVTSVGSRPRVLKNLQEMKEKAELLNSKSGSNAIVLTDDERAMQRTLAEERLSKDFHVHEMRFSTPKDVAASKAFDVEVLYGKESGGFDTWIEAQSVAKKAGDGSEVVIFDAGKGVAHKVDGDVKVEDMVNPQFYVQKRESNLYEVQDNLLDVPIFNERAKYMKGNGHVTSWLKDNGNRLNTHIMNSLNLAQDTRGVLRKRLQEFSRPFTGLKVQSQGRVLHMIQEGEDSGKVLTLEDMLRMYPDVTDKEINGYFALRAVSDMNYDIKNRAMRTSLVRDGYSNYTFGSGRVIARQLKQKPEAGKHIWDAEANSIVKLEQKELDELYARGGHVARLRTPEVVGRTKTDYVMVKDAKARGELPQQVLNYRAGHVSRHYKEKWFVDVEKVVRYNGVDETHRITLGAYPDLDSAKAHRFSEEIQAKIDSGEYTLVEPRLDRSVGINSKGEFEQADVDGLLYTAKRGDHLAGIERGRIAQTEDIMSSLEKDIDNASYLATHEEVITNLSARLKKAYPDSFDKRSGKFLVGKSKEADEAHGVLELLKGVPATSDKVTQAAIVRLSNYLEDKGKAGKWVSKAVFDRSGFSIAQAARSLTHATFIAMNPAKQLVLQGSQFLMLASAHPVQAAKALTQSMAFHIGYLMRNSKQYSRVEGSLAKAAGVSREEYRAMRLALEDSGLLQSLANHATLQTTDIFASNLKYAKGLELTKQRLGNAVKTPFRVASKMGFQSGEAHNLTVSWLMVHNLWKQANKGKKWVGDKDLAAQWGAKARQWTFNANKMGSFKFQHGSLAAATQFWSFQLKAWHAVTSSPAFSRSEKMRMLLGMATMWGTGGIMAPQAWSAIEEEMGWKVDKDTRDMIEHGLLDYAINSALTTEPDAKGRGTQIALSESMSPMNGIHIILDTMSKEATLGTFLTGVTTYTTSGYLNALKFATDAWKYPELDTPEAMGKVVTNLATAFPLFSNLQRGIMALNTMKHVSKSTLRTGEDITTQEAIALMTTGFMSRKELDALNQRIEDAETYQELEDMGKRLAHHYNSEVNNSMSEYGTVPPEVWQRIATTMRTVSAGMSVKQKDTIMRGFKKYFVDTANVDDATERYLNSTFQLSTDVEDVVQQVRGDSRFTQEESDKLEKLLRRMYKVRELSAEGLD